MGSPVLVARVRITNGGGTWDTLSPGDVQPRIVWTSTLTLDNEPNTATVQVYNVAPDSVAKVQGVVTKRLDWTPAERAELLAAGASAEPFETTTDNLGLGNLELSWGFADSADLSEDALVAALSVGFEGQITKGPKVVQSGNDRILTCVVQDGGITMGAGEAMQTAGGNVVAFEGKSYAPNTPLAEIVRDLANALGLSADQGAIAKSIELGLAARGLPGADATFLGSYNASGPARQQLDKIIASVGLRWSVQRGEFQLLAPGQALPGLDPLVLSSDLANLIGEPQTSGDDKQAQTQATTRAIPGRRVDIVIGEETGAYIVGEATTNGDTLSGGLTDIKLEAFGTSPILAGL